MSNPSAGTVVTVPAGGQTEVCFDFENEAPFVAGFHLEVDGLPTAAWASGVGEGAQVMAPAYGGGTVTLTLAPPPGAASGEHPLKARIVSDGAVVGKGEIPLVLRVEGSATAVVHEAPPPVTPVEEPVARPEPTPEPDPEPVVATPPPPEEKAPVTPTADTAAVTPAEPAEEALPVVEAPVVEPPKPEPKPEPKPVPAVEPAAKPAEAVVQVPVTPQRTAPSEPSTGSTSSTSSTPTPEGPPRQTARAVPVRPVARAQPVTPPKPPDPPPPVVEDLPVVEVPEEEEEEPQEQVPDAPSVADPPDGMVVPLKPGESTYIRFNIHNEAARDRTYIVEEDRALPSEWIKLVQDRVNITHNATGQVFAKVSTPIDAEPGAYPFQLRYGQQGGILTPCNLVLQVLPTPAVALTAKATTVSTGPFGRAVNFALTVASAGNADTAFRIAVRAPLAEGEQAGQPASLSDQYETERWRYLFDKEIDNLESAADRAPMPKPVRLQIWRKGFWWFGFRESQKVRVAAVPVTDLTNGGKPGNTLELTATRWRILPLPGFLALPLALLLLVMLGSGAHDVTVTNAKTVGERYYVIQPRQENPKEGVPVGKMSAALRWSAPWYAALNLDTTEPAQTFHFVRGGFDAPLPVGNFGSLRTFVVRPALVGRGELVNVTYVPIWTVGKLQVSTGPPERKVTAGFSPVVEKIGTDEVPVQGAVITLRVPRDRYLSVNFQNLTPLAGEGGRHIQVWVAGRPNSDQIETRDLKDSYDLGPGQFEVPVKLKVIANPEPGQELVFITSDASCQMLRLKLEAQ